MEHRIERGAGSGMNMRFLKTTRPPLLIRYGVAALAVGLALLVKLLVDPLIEEETPFLLFSVAVVFSAWFGGLRPGLFATALAALAADYFFLSPVYTLLVYDFGQGLRLALFVLEGSFVSLLVTAIRSARRQAASSARQAREDRESLRHSEERFRSLVLNASDMIVVLDAGGTITYESPAVERVLGFKPEERVGTSAFEYVHPDDLEPAKRAVAELVGKRGSSRSLEYRVRDKKGHWRHFEAIGNDLLHDPSVGGIIVNSRDITERKRAEEALSEAREAERRRIAADLHDEVLQDLIHGLQEAQLTRLRAAGGGGPDDAKESIHDSLEMIGESLQNSVEGLREAIFELRLKEDLERSVVSSIEALVELNRRMSRKRYEVRLSVEEGFPGTLPTRTGGELVRIVQEALNNARRHSGARNVRVCLDIDGDGVYAEVSDDGCGFQVGEARGGFGTGAMRRRAQELGGELEIESEPGAGTTVRFRAPAHRLLGG